MADLYTSSPLKLWVNNYCELAVLDTYGIKVVSGLLLLTVLKAMHVSSVPTVITTPRARVKMKPAAVRRSSMSAKTEKLKRDKICEHLSYC